MGEVFVFVSFFTLVEVWPFAEDLHAQSGESVKMFWVLCEVDVLDRDVREFQSYGLYEIAGRQNISVMRKVPAQEALWIAVFLIPFNHPFFMMKAQQN